jgi:hypothetical protein
LTEAEKHGQTILLSMDQTDLGNRMALLMISLRVGDRALLSMAGGNRGGKHRLQRAKAHVGAGVGLDTGWSPGAVVSRSFLSLHRFVQMTAQAGLAVSAAPEQQYSG